MGQFQCNILLGIMASVNCCNTTTSCCKKRKDLPCSVIESIQEVCSHKGNKKPCCDADKSKMVSCVPDDGDECCDTDHDEGRCDDTKEHCHHHIVTASDSGLCEVKKCCEDRK